MGYHKAPKSRRKLQFFLALALLILFLFSLSYYWGRPIEPQYFEVDVTEKIAEFAQDASAGSQNRLKFEKLMAESVALESAAISRIIPFAAEGLYL